MERYRNVSGSSGVVAYSSAANHIDVEFVDGKIYRYSNEYAGRENIKQMKALAKTGKGLSTFITQNVRDLYEKRLR